MSETRIYTFSIPLSDEATQTMMAEIKAYCKQTGVPFSTRIVQILKVGQQEMQRDRKRS